jgi:hypothetical protein
VNCACVTIKANSKVVKLYYLTSTSWELTRLDVLVFYGQQKSTLGCFFDALEKPYSD